MLCHCIVSATGRLKNLSSDIEIAGKRIKKYVCYGYYGEVGYYLLAFI